MFGVIAIAVVVVVILHYVWKEIRTNRQLPPGPWAALPLVGTSSRLDQMKPYVTLTDWSDIYGEVFSFTQLGGKKTIVCNDEQSIKEVLFGPNADDLAARPRPYRYKLLRPGRSGVVFGDLSPAWKLMKRGMMTSMKMFGEGLDQLEEITIQVINEMLETFSDHGREAFNPNFYLSQFAAKIIATLAYGNLPSKEILTLFSVIEENEALLLAPSGKGSELDWFPWLRFVMREVYTDLMKTVKLDWFVFDSLLQKRIADCDLNNPKCVMDSLLRIQDRVRKDPKIKEEDKLMDNDLHQMSRDIIMAGTATTHRALYSLIAILACHPHVQRALQEEVDRVCGERQPLVADKLNMHYTIATIWELFRYNAEVPLLIPHLASKDTVVAGYKVPKGSEVWCNVWKLHHDERYWKDPWKFQPERYLDDNGVIVPTDHPHKTRSLVFGAGRRSCPAEVLARNRIFLFLSTFMQKFSFLPSEGADAPKYDPRDYGPGLTILPLDYKIVAVQRDK